MVNYVDKNACCGCGACAQACPVKCITMQADAEGFVYPHVDQSHCISCGTCQKACSAEEKVSVSDTPISAYVAYAKDAKVRNASSSGGVFTLLASWILKNNGVVFGAAFDEDWSVHHVMVDSMDSLQKLQGSKYLQSRIESTYCQAKAALDEGRFVLFSGTVCQTAALVKFLDRKYDKLFAVDVICHGVPSPLVWDRYLASYPREHVKQIHDFSFRNKKSGWKSYSVNMQLSNGTQYSRQAKDDPYMQVFLRDICLRPSCYHCAYKGMERAADLTLGDAWGIQNWMPDMDDDGGTSAVLLHSQKGHQLWNAILPDTVAREVDASTVIRDNPAFIKSARIHPKRMRFFEALRSGADMEKLEKISRPTLLRRGLQFGKRVAKKIVRLLRNT